MPELPDEADLDQLRAQARELLRAARTDDPEALGRLRAVSGRVNLADARLAVAREYGYSSWANLEDEVDHRRSFGGASPMEVADGIMTPRLLRVDPGRAALDVTLVPAAAVPTGRPGPRWGLPWGIGILRRRRPPLPRPAFADVRLIDDRGAGYALRVQASGGSVHRSGRSWTFGPMHLQLEVEPVPGRRVGWLELRNASGAASRLLPSARASVHIGELRATGLGDGERALLELVYSLIQLRLLGLGRSGKDMLTKRCDDAVTKIQTMRAAGEIDPSNQLADHVERLAASLQAHVQPEGIPVGWSRMLEADSTSDGPARHLDLRAVLPSMEGVELHLDSLISEADAWRLHLRALPKWWRYSEDRRNKWSPVLVGAEDDRGGMYVSVVDGGSLQRDYEQLALRFLPRLDPLARRVVLNFSGVNEELSVAIELAATAT